MTVIAERFIEATHVGFPPPARRAVLKVVESVDLPYRFDPVELARERGTIPWDELIQRFPDLRMERLFFSVTGDELEAAVDRARETDPNYSPVNFFSYFVFDLLDDQRIGELVTVLAALPDAEFAYVQPRLTKPTCHDQAGQSTAGQGYLSAASSGIDAGFAWTVPGGTGKGVRYIDLEEGWYVDANQRASHPDLANADLSVEYGTVSANTADREHGTNTLGVISAQDNTFGILGVAYDAEGGLVSPIDASGTKNLPASILKATLLLDFGDVLLIEEALDVPGNLPIEVEPANQDVIRLATALGRIVIEPAGNGGVSLNNISLLGKAELAFPHPPDSSADSGAIVVGASQGAVAPIKRKGSSNHGNRVDLFAWGNGVCTTSGDDYAQLFGDTSAASAIIAGASLSVQGAHLHATNGRLSPRQLRSLLRDRARGPTLTDPDPDGIGVMPNLKGILKPLCDRTYGVVDVYLRDAVGDHGDPHMNPKLSQSPDIIVTTDLKSTAEANSAWGHLSGKEDDEDLGTEVTGGVDHHCYVRVLNRGNLPETDVRVDLYWSLPTTNLVNPSSWAHNLIGTAVLPLVPSGEQLTVSGPVLWKAADIPGDGHYCLIAIANSPGDPAPVTPATLVIPQTLSSQDRIALFQAFIRSNNNVALRNFVILEGLTGSSTIMLPYMAVGAESTGESMQFVVHAKLPNGSSVEMELDLEFALRLGFSERQLSKGDRRDFRRMSLRRGSTTVGPVTMHPCERQPMAVIVTLDRIPSRRTYEVCVRQLQRSVEVGRFTLRFGA